MLNNEDLLKISELMDVKLNMQTKLMERKFDGIEGKLDVLDSRVGILEEKVTALEVEAGGLHEKIDALNIRSRNIELVMENDIRPRLSNIESCYVDTYDRYALGIIEMDSIRADVDILKNVAAEHSKILQNVR